MRLIDADALGDVIQILNGKNWGITRGDYKMIDAVLFEFPTIEPQRKTGKWIRHPERKNIYGGKCVECSECGEMYMVQYIEDEKFCRNCGADMRGEQDESI
ncbi:MAG: hypothetical protein IJP92_08590 [Lachnospiraceae bacterium]|nr:hypothetical protein [Oscillospiraceae bacterium]MBR0091743.1 hypothetical protein [Lachnospiraceae bacterium]